jgi:transcriptional regulator with XRE-family HTH domain
METEDHRKLLGAFLRAHRERLRPQGNPGRRRTPGLRREELAARAGISATWCTWIEQGREVKASPQALGRLARALELSRAERAYLFDLAGQRDPEASMSEPVDDAPASLRTAVAAIRHPAYGLDRLWNACCWNKAAERLFTGWLSGNCQRNLLRFVFLDPHVRAAQYDWDSVARFVVGAFRVDAARAGAEVGPLVDELCRLSPEFRAMWRDNDVSSFGETVKRIRHPVLGPVSFEYSAFAVDGRSDLSMVIYNPATATDARKISSLIEARSQTTPPGE